MSTQKFHIPVFVRFLKKMNFSLDIFLEICYNTRTGSGEKGFYVPSQKNTPARQRAQAKYNSKPEQIKRRASRNAARAKMMAAGKVRKGDGKDVMHKNGNPNNNNSANLRVGSQKENRSYARTRTARKKNPRS